MNKNAKIFLRSAVILTLALLLIVSCMREWGAAQIIIVILVAALAAGQWGLFFYIKKK